MPLSIGTIASHYTKPLASVSLLLNANGTNGAQNNTFVDSSSTPKTITRNGSVTQGSVSPFPLNGAAYNPAIHGGSGYFNGSSYLISNSNSELALGTGDFTLEAWVHPANTTSTYKAIIADNLYNSTTGGWTIYQYGSEIRIWVTGFQILTFTNVLVTNQWTHIVWSRSGNINQLFINGELKDTTTRLDNFTGTSTIIGSNNATGGPYRFNGYMSNVRIVKGTAVYTSNFTVPTAPLTNISGTSLLLNFTNGGVIDSVAKNNLVTLGDARISTGQSKFGGSSLYFDGSGDGLTADVPGDDFGAGDFTIEGFWYFADLGSASRILIARWTSSSGGWNFYYQGSSRRLSFYVNSGNVLQSPPDVLNLNTWHHIVVSRQSGTLRMFVDGDLKATGLLTTSFNQIRRIDVGFQTGGSGPLYFNGYMDDLRITNGALYTRNFTPPTSQLPPTDPINLNLL